MRGPSLLLVLVSVLGGVGAYRSSSASGKDNTTQSGRAATAITDAKSSEADGLAETFSKFDRLRKFLISTDPAALPTFTWSAFPRVDSARTADPFDWAIATVPDPEHSLLTLNFDREIEAIQLAATDAGYQFERHWFPWHTATTRQVEKSDKDANYAVTLHPFSATATISLPRNDEARDLPGVLLFRKSPPGHPLAIFLVGETPTGGISAAQFRTAVSLGRSLSREESGNDQLRLIGPGFSGSFASLQQLIGSENPSFGDLSISTWTSDHRSHKNFKPAVESTRPMDQEQLENVEAINTFACYVRNVWHDNSPIMILTEEQTAFGSFYQTDVLGKDQSGNPPECPPKNDPGFSDRLVSKIYTVTFPRNLSRLRNASEEQEHVPGFAADPEQLRVGLPLSLREEGEGEEIPMFSRRQTPISEESVLFTIGGMLKTGVIHYVGISATDALDTLFLARYLHSACPNIRLFVPNADLLFEHGSDSSDYSGVLSISRYPLFPFTQIWTSSVKEPPDPLHVFPAADVEGIYNSALYVLWPLNHPDHHPPARDDLNPLTHSHGPAWITVAGRSGFEPIAVLKIVGSTEAASGHNLIPEYWPLWGYILTFILLLCLAYCGAVLLADPSDWHVIGLFSACAPRPYDESQVITRAFYLSSIGFLLALLVTVWIVVPGVILQQNWDRTLIIAKAGVLFFTIGIIAIVVVISNWSPKAETNGSLAINSATPLNVASFFMEGGALLLVFFGIYPDFTNHAGVVFPRLWLFYCLGCFVAGATFLSACLPLWPVRRYTEKLNSHYFWGTCFLGLIAILAICFAGVVVFGRDSADFLAAYRSLDLTNDISPLIPITLLLVALIATFFMQLRRYTYSIDRQPLIPAMEADPFCQGLNNLERKINNRISLFYVHKREFGADKQIHWLYLIVLVPLVFAAVYAVNGSFQTVEAWALEHLIIGLVFATILSILFSSTRFVLIWSAFSEFLQQLERHPIRWVFSLLPKEFMWSPVWQGGGKKRTHVLITRSVECLRALYASNRVPPVLAPEGVNLKDLSTEVGIFLSKWAQSSFDTKRFQAIEKSFKKAADSAVASLVASKWMEGDYELKAQLAAKEENKSALRVLWPEFAKEEPSIIRSEFVAFRFLAYINYVLWHLETLVLYISTAFLLLVVAVNSYAFRSKTVFDWALVGLFAVLSVGIITVFAQADRDAILSRISGTAEGKLDRHFFTHVLSYGALPAVALLASHFPTIGHFFFSWVKPAMEAIH